MSTDRSRAYLRLPMPLSVFALLAIVSSACTQQDRPAHEFALFGDNPYSFEAVSKVRALITDVNAQPDLAWVIHVGDIKGGQQPCTDELLRERFELYQEFAVPFVLTPGDNDWFDCTGKAAGAYDDYERLGFLRSLFFPEPNQTTGRRVMEVQSQSLGEDFPEFVENVRWIRDDVVYATVHLIAITRPPTDSLIAERRMDAAIAWLREAFDLAKNTNAPGVFIATQVDLWPIRGGDPRRGLERIYPVLRELVAGFGNPVVFGVGDTHFFRVDKPLTNDDGQLVANFTRVEVFGSPNVHWVRVSVGPGSRNVFSFRQEMVPGN